MKKVFESEIASQYAGEINEQVVVYQMEDNDEAMRFVDMDEAQIRNELDMWDGEDDEGRYDHCYELKTMYTFITVFHKWYLI